MTARRLRLALAVVLVGGFTAGFIEAATGMPWLGSLVMFNTGAAAGVLVWDGVQ